ncbi:MAG: DUF1992 domain-containing protein [Rubrivivax sp.]|nr:DUF1992 domain-containing protein [Rubrivivax sp.]
MSGVSKAQEEREKRLKLVEDHIGRHLAESERSGELQRAPSYGKPLDFGDGYEQTPAELRMPMKVLKDAGVMPPEVELMREIAALQAELDLCLTPETPETPEAPRMPRTPDAPAPEVAALSRTQVLRQRLADKRQALALRLEKLRASSTL